MPLFDTTPPPPSDPAHDWYTRSVQGGTTVTGIVAGPLVGSVMHFDGCSKPCYAAITKGRMACPRCPDPYERWLGYLPVVVFPGPERTVLMLSSTVGRFFLTAGYHDPFYFSRPPGANCKLRIKQAKDHDVPSDLLAKVRRWKPVDITPYLLHMWQEHPLTRFLGADPVEAKKSTLKPHPTDPATCDRTGDRGESNSVLIPDAPMKEAHAPDAPAPARRKAARRSAKPSPNGADRNGHH